MHMCSRALRLSSLRLPRRLHTCCGLPSVFTPPTHALHALHTHHAAIIYLLKSRLSIAQQSRRLSKMDCAPFAGVPDRYSGMTIDSTLEPCEVDNFQSKIDNSLIKWKDENKRCIWFKVNIKDSAWVPHLANRGFNFHHSRHDFVMMYKWLPDSEPNLPPACHTNLGVGGMVINDQNQILVVSEKHYEYPHWKLPGGYVERGEYMIDAAVREVKEETGIDSEFVSLIAIRQTHKMMFENSDLYTIVLLKPTSHDIQISEREINQCQWMDIKEFLNHPNVHEFNRIIVDKAIAYKEKGIKVDAERKTVKYANIVREIDFISVNL